MCMQNFKGFCCGCSLEVGGLVIGWLHLITSIVGVVLGIQLLQFHSVYSDIILSPQHLGIAIFVLSVAGVMISIMLIVGVSTGNEKNLNTWGIITSYSFVMCLVMNFVQLIKLMIVGEMIKALAFVFFLSVYTAIVTYFICVVQNLTKKIVSEKYSPLHL